MNIKNIAASAGILVAVVRAYFFGILFCQYRAAHIDAQVGKGKAAQFGKIGIHTIVANKVLDYDAHDSQELRNYSR